MRPILDEQTYLNFAIRTSNKIVERYRAKYAWYDECLMALPEILAYAHQDLKRLSVSREGRKAGYTSENLFRAMLVHQTERTSLRNTIVRIAESETLRGFIRLGPRDVMDSSFLNRAFKALSPEAWGRINDALKRYAVDRRGTDVSRIRTDSTVMQEDGFKTLTVARGQDHGSSPQSHSTGALIRRLSSGFAINVYNKENGSLITESLSNRIKDLRNYLRDVYGISFTTYRVPVMYAVHDTTPLGVDKFAAVTANMVNSVVDHDVNAGWRMIATNPGNARFRQIFSQYDGVFSAGATAWDNYHRYLGELHCGSNAKRTLPNPAWWTYGEFSNWGE